MFCYTTDSVSKNIILYVIGSTPVKGISDLLGHSGTHNSVG